MLIKHVQDMIRARGVGEHNNSIVISFHKLSNTYNMALPQMVMYRDHIFKNLNAC